MHLIIFDLDHTLLTINSSFRYYFLLFRLGVFAPISFFFALLWGLLFRLSFLSPEILHRKIFEKFLKKLPFSSLLQPASFFSLELQRFLYQPLLQAFEDAKKRGDYTLLLSASPTFLIAPLAKSLGFHEWKGSEYGLDKEECLEHISSLMSGREKREYALQLCERLSLKREKMVFYTDSYWDLPLLEISGRPVGVHPDYKLKSVCRKRGWEVMG